MPSASPNQVAVAAMVSAADTVSVLIADSSVSSSSICDCVFDLEGGMTSGLPEAMALVMGK